MHIVYYGIILSLLCLLAFKANDYAMHLRGWLRNKGRMRYDDGKCYIVTFKKGRDNIYDPIDHEMGIVPLAKTIIQEIKS